MSQNDVKSVPDHVARQYRVLEDVSEVETARAQFLFGTARELDQLRMGRQIGRWIPAFQLRGNDAFGRVLADVEEQFTQRFSPPCPQWRCQLGVAAGGASLSQRI